MSMDDDDADDAVGRVPPLPPDDRLWRHPSELSGLTARPVDDPRGGSIAGTGRGPVWAIAVVAGLVGAVLCGGALAATGSLSGGRQTIVEKVALTPVVSAPTIRGGDPGVEALAQRVGPSVARLLVTTTSGTAPASAVVYRGDGLLLTSAHEVVGATEIVVLLPDGRRLQGELVGADLPTDVAILAVDADRLMIAVLGSSADLEVGATTMAVGSSEAGGSEAAVSTGVVSALDRRIDVDGETLHGMIQTDAPIGAGWSGGPLVDGRGAVIGITTDLAGREAGFGFATPIDLVKRIAEELVASGTVVHGWLGIEGADLTDAQSQAMGVPAGAMVRAIANGSPAADSGLEPNDIITEIGDHAVTSSSGLVVAMRHQRPGDDVVVGYWRDGRHHETTVTIQPHP